MDAQRQEGASKNASSPDAETRIAAFRYWPVDYNTDTQQWRMKISGFFLAEADTPEEAFRLGRLAMAAYCKVKPEDIPERFSNDFVAFVSRLYRKYYTEPRTEAKFWGFCEELGDRLITERWKLKSSSRKWAGE
jgi:hypothetical protein